MLLILILKTTKLFNVLGIKIKNCNNKVVGFNISGSNIDFAKK